HIRPADILRPHILLELTEWTIIEPDARLQRDLQGKISLTQSEESLKAEDHVRLPIRRLGAVRCRLPLHQCDGQLIELLLIRSKCVGTIEGRRTLVPLDD